MMKTLVAPITPSGQGAIATILLDGPNARILVEKHFRPADGSFEQSFRLTQWHRGVHDLRPILLGHFVEYLHEEVVLTQINEHQFEIHCHGGTTVVSTLLSVLEKDDCEVLSWQSYLDRSEMTLLTTEAIQAMSRASSPRTASILLDQYQGAMEREINSLFSRYLTPLLPHPAAPKGSFSKTPFMDDPIKESEPFPDTPISLLESLELALTQLLDRGQWGLHLVDPWKISIAGPPNAGKSTLINSLLGLERVVTDGQPGTTRDLISCDTVLDGWPVQLIDTAGIHRNTDFLEHQAILKTQQSLQCSDLIILVFDQSVPLSKAHLELINRYPKAVYVGNKCDLPTAEESPAFPVGTLFLSALNSDDLYSLINEIVTRLIPQPASRGDAVPFTARQNKLLKNALDAVQSNHLKKALHDLQSLTDSK